MPFFDNTGVDTDVRNGPVWDAFSSLRDQLERLIVLNIVWAAQLVPGMLALALPQLPGAVRVLLIVYSVVLLAPATGALYGLMLCAARYEPLSLALAREVLLTLALPSLRTLAPLFGVLGTTMLAVLGADLLQQTFGGIAALALGVVLRVALLLGLTCAMYWGPLFADAPERPAPAIARDSLLLVWRFPARTLQVALVVLLALVVGLISIGGLFLAVPVLVALLQTHLYLSLAHER